MFHAFPQQALKLAVLNQEYDESYALSWWHSTMHYLYGSKKEGPRRLVATFGSEQQLLAYVRWATLQSLGHQRGKFEQGSALASYDAWEQAIEPLTDEDASGILYNPTPTML